MFMDSELTFGKNKVWHSCRLGQVNESTDEEHMCLPAGHYSHMKTVTTLRYCAPPARNRALTPLPA